MSRKPEIIFFFLFSLLIGTQATSQTSSFRHIVYTTSDGLPYNQVRCIVKDHFGFLWIATWDGLSCFDGTNFTNYFHNPADAATIPYFEVQDLAVDKDNTIWVQAGQLCKYVREKGVFTTYSPSSPNYIASSHIYSIATDKHGVLTVFGDAGFEHYNPHTGRFETDGFILDKRTNPVLFSFDNSDNIWLYDIIGKTTLQLKKTPGAGKKPGSFKVEGRYTIPFDDEDLYNYFYHMKTVVPGDGRVWITSNQGLYYKNAGSDKFLKYSEESKDISLLPSSTDLLWSDTDKGLYYYDAAGKKINRYAEKQTRNVESFFRDPDGIIWYGGSTASGRGIGLHEIINIKTGFNYYLNNCDSDYQEPIVFCIAEDSKYNLWIGVKNQPWLLKISPGGTVSKENMLKADLYKKGDQPRAIIEDYQHHLWIGYDKGLLMKSDPGKQKFFAVFPDPTRKKQAGKLSSYKNLKLLPDSTILAAGSDGCCILDPISGKILFSSILPGNTAIYSTYVDPENTIWLGGNGKLIHYDPKLRLVENLIVAGGKYNIEYICRDTLNRIWLALLGGGICNFDLRSHQSTIYASQNGLFNNATYCILKDKIGNLWISTNHGLSMFNTRTKRFMNYATRNEQDLDEFNANACFAAKDGKLFFGGMSGFVSFYPDSMTDKPDVRRSRVIITNLDIFEHGRFDYLPVFDLKNVRVPKGIRIIRVNFAIPDYVSSGKYNIRYRITGLNEQWKLLKENIRNILFENMKPGEYEFQIETTNSKGEWNSRNTLTIVITPLLSETLFFRVFVILFIVLITGLGIYIYLRSIRRKQQIRETQLKLITAQSQLSPHFISNCLNVIGSYLPEWEEVNANAYISEIAQLIRYTIEYIGREYIPFSLAINMVSKYLNAERMRLDLKFDYEINIDNIEPDGFMIAPAMIQPIAENSIHHGLPEGKDKKGKIVIHFDPPGNKYITCTIQDNGKGWEESSIEDLKKQRQSYGLKIIRERIRLYNELNKTNLTMKITHPYPDQEEKGTMVKIDIPIKKQ